MKTLSALLVLLTLCTTSVLFAGNGESILKKKVSNAIKYPSLKAEKKVETTVTAWVTVDVNGDVKVTGMTSASPEAATAIKQQLEKIKNIPVEGLTGKTFAYRFVLKVQ